MARPDLDFTLNSSYFCGKGGEELIRILIVLTLKLIGRISNDEILY